MDKYQLQAIIVITAVAAAVYTHDGGYLWLLGLLLFT